MRTNVVLDEKLVAEAMRLTGIRTKRGVIDEALRTLVRLERQKDVLALKGKIIWEGDLDAMRADHVLADERPEYHGDRS